MLPLIAGLVVFIGIHLVPTLPALRQRLMRALSPGAYQAAFSLVSLAGLALLIYGFARRPYLPVWTPPDAARHLAYPLVLAAFILVTSAYVPSRIRHAVGHPMLIGVALWAAAHLTVNGDLAGIVLFASFLGYALYDLASATRRRAFGPLGTRRGDWRGDVIAIAVGAASFGLMLVWGHRLLIGIPLILNQPAP